MAGQTNVLMYDLRFEVAADTNCVQQMHVDMT